MFIWELVDELKFPKFIHIGKNFVVVIGLKFTVVFVGSKKVGGLVTDELEQQPDAEWTTIGAVDPPLLFTLPP
jgi:hypothetical protein